MNANTSRFEAAPRQFVVELLGFDEGEHSLLTSTFRLTSRRLYCYAEDSAARTDLYLVNSDNPDALKALRERAPNLYCPAVLIGRESRDQPWFSVERPIHWSRLFDTLDRVMQIAVDRRDARPSGNPGGDFLRRRTDRRETASRPSASTPVKREAVLVVDDSSTVRAFMRGKLAPFRFDVDFTSSGQTAIEMARAKPYACIFLDVLMPGIDGYETCKRLKSDPRSQSTAVVMISSKSSPLDKLRGNLSGCDAYLGKPVDEDELLATIARYLPSARRVVSAMLG